MALKIPPDLVVLVAALLIWLIRRFVGSATLAIPGAALLALFVFAIGTLIVFLGIRTFRQAKTTVNPLNPTLASSLVMHGIYHYTRNPMYMGMALWLLAWGIYLENWLALLIIPLFVLYMTQFQIKPEEASLENKFGADYRAYQQRVRRWL